MKKFFFLFFVSVCLFLTSCRETSGVTYGVNNTEYILMIHRVVKNKRFP